MKNKILLSFDIEEFDLPCEYNHEVSEFDKFEISRLGTVRILELLAKYQIRATFFVTANFAQKYPELIVEMVKNSHEIASHGVDHSSFEVADLTKSKEILEQISGQKIIGFRMARLAKVDKKEIFEANYVYESSLNPVYLPGRYNNFSAPLLPFNEAFGLRQYPISALPLMRFPLFWLSFKNLPEFIYLVLAIQTLKFTGYFNLYTHPWEYNEASQNPKFGIPKYITRHAGMSMLKRLEEFILKMRQVGEFITFRDSIEANNHE